MVVVRQKVVVKKEGRIELNSPELLEGATAEVIVLIEAAAKAPSLESLLGKASGNFGSRAEADEHIRKERDTWIS
jgi:hypothetical protein